MIRFRSTIEAAANALIGYGCILLVQLLIFPVFGLDATLRQHLGIAAVFALADFLRARLTPPLFDPAVQSKGHR